MKEALSVKQRSCVEDTLKLALEALQDAVLDYSMGKSAVIRHAEAITAIKEALAQPEQEPVGVVCMDISNAHMMYGTQYLGQQPDKKTTMLFKDLEVGTQLYTAPPPVAEPHKRKPLTDEMIVAGGKALAKLHAESCGLDFDDVWKYYAEDHKADAKAAIEAAHGIKE